MKSKSDTQFKKRMQKRCKKMQKRCKKNAKKMQKNNII